MSSLAVRKLREEMVRVWRKAGLRQGDRILVACSYGPDSLALADAVLALRRRLGLGPVTLVYVNHGLRPEASAEALAVVAFATEHQAEARVASVALDRGRGGGLEEAARVARYAALSALADELGAVWILLGHTASDQAETLLERLIRGAGVLGLGAIPPTRGRFFRPLLGLLRRDIAAYVRARSLEPAHDAMNDDPRFLRVRMRHTVLPLLFKENPAIEATLARTARTLREAAEAIEVWVDQVAPAILQRRPGGGVELLAPGLARLPAAVRKRLIQRCATEIGASLGAVHLEAASTLAIAPAAGTRVLAVPNLSLRREYDLLIIENETQPVGRLASALFQVEVRGSGGPFRARTFQPGDRMRPARLAGRSRKLQDLFCDLKVPAPLRKTCVVVVRERDGEIVWAEHIGPAAGVDLEVSLTLRDPGAING